MLVHKTWDIYCSMYGSTLSSGSVVRVWCDIYMDQNSQLYPRIAQLLIRKGTRQAWRGCGSSFMKSPIMQFIGESRKISCGIWTILASYRMKIIARSFYQKSQVICGQITLRGFSASTLLFVFLPWVLWPRHY